MKRYLLILLFLFSLLGCGSKGAQTTWNYINSFGEPATVEHKMDVEVSPQATPYSYEALQKLLEATGASKVRAFDHLTGDDTGALDKIDTAEIVSGDFAFTVTSAGQLYIHVYNSTSTEATDSPWYVRPNDFSSAGVWELVKGITMLPTSTPEIILRDLEASDFDDNVILQATCTDTGSGTEDCDFKVFLQIAGAETEVLSFDADGTTANFQSFGIIARNVDAGMQVSEETGNPVTVTGNSKFYINDDDDAIEFDLDADPVTATGYGKMFCFHNFYDQVITVDPNGTDNIIRNGVGASGGEAYVSTGAAGETLCVIGLDTNNWLIYLTVGEWDEASPP